MTHSTKKIQEKTVGDKAVVDTSSVDGEMPENDRNDEVDVPVGGEADKVE